MRIVTMLGSWYGREAELSVPMMNNAVLARCCRECNCFYAYAFRDAIPTMIGSHEPGEKIDNQNSGD